MAYCACFKAEGVVNFCYELRRGFGRLLLINRKIDVSRATHGSEIASIASKSGCGKVQAIAARGFLKIHRLASTFAPMFIRRVENSLSPRSAKRRDETRCGSLKAAPRLASLRM